jgi:hypothetical protein
MKLIVAPFTRTTWGARGIPAGVTGSLAADGSDVPNSFVAATVNV